MRKRHHASSPPAVPCSASASCCCPSAGLARRQFIKLTGLAAGGVTVLPVMAGPFTRSDFEQLVPADKKLHPDWVKSLFERGQPTVYRWPESRLIGMPIGGICAGQVYLGGDGKLWHWDIFNQHIATGAGHYARPLTPSSPLDQGFALMVADGDKVDVRPLDHTGWSEISFRGEYPIGFVEYRDPDCLVAVSLEAFSPFIPLNVEDSSWPAIVMRFTVRNTSPRRLEVELGGWLENAVCLHSARRREGQRQNRLVRQAEYLALECSAGPAPAAPAAERRPDMVLEDFETDTYQGWTPTGTAFGQGPVEMDRMPPYQGKVGGHGRRVVNSHAAAPGNTVESKDAHTGTLTSRPFRLERNYLNFLIGGGAHAGRTCVNLLVDGRVVLSATGKNDNRMSPVSWDVRRWAGKTAQLQVVDQESGSWGNIGLDYIVLSDQPQPPPGPLTDEPDFGTMSLALLQPGPADTGTVELRGGGVPAGLFSKVPASPDPVVTRPFGQKLVGALRRRLSLGPGQSGEAVFCVAWHFPNLRIDRLPPGRYYATRFSSALGVVEALARRYQPLRLWTGRWHDTWYDSTLPYWFLDRTFLNSSILATSTCHRFADGRFWGWEGVGCCAGTCAHVWHYAHAVARLFPQLERDTRQRVDFGLAQQPDGAIFFRAEFNNFPAVDGQAGTVLRALREHQMCPDDAWLRHNWPAIRKATEWLIAKDGNGDGLIEGNQHNTLDADWFGPVAWLSGLYLAALRAAETMAQEVGDQPFARRCRDIFQRGQRKLVAELFDGEYFINRPDPKHPEAINSGTGCHIDQVMGQSWAWQVGLGRVLPIKETVSALKALWRYNFTPDVGPYRQRYKSGRWYAMPGEAGLLMCTFPRQDWDYAQAKGKGPDGIAGYFNECMSGFEYQVAGHLLWEGLVLEGLAITRAVHDRYHASRRNPWNEVECGDHYARSMASYGVFLAACGYEYHGPKGHLGFAPRLAPEQFKAAFTAAEGWGSYSQQAGPGGLTARIDLRWGRLRLRTLAVGLQPGFQPTQVRAQAAGQPVSATLTFSEGKARLSFEPEVMLAEGQALEVQLG